MSEKGSRGLVGVFLAAAALALSALLAFGCAPNLSSDGSLTTDTSTSPTTGNTWTRAKQSGPWPGARFLPAMVYVPTVSQVLMFGGVYSETPESGIVLDDCWTYDPGSNAWTQEAAQNQLPAARLAASLAYCSDFDLVVLFGGLASGMDTLADTWTYDVKSNVWTETTPPGAGPPSMGYMSYDAPSKRVIMVGALAGDQGQPGNEVWTYDVAASLWNKVDTQGNLPEARANPKLAYDPIRRQMFMLGGVVGSRVLNDFWSFDVGAATWTKIQDSAPFPPASTVRYMVYDSAADRIILLNGEVTSDGESFMQTWEYTPAANAWRELESGGMVPEFRGGGSMVFDHVSGQCLLYGGFSQTADGQITYYNDVWLYTPSRGSSP